MPVIFGFFVSRFILLNVVLHYKCLIVRSNARARSYPGKGASTGFESWWEKRHFEVIGSHPHFKSALGPYTDCRIPFV
jgi:hypothetical protein